MGMTGLTASAFFIGAKGRFGLRDRDGGEEKQNTLVPPRCKTQLSTRSDGSHGNFHLSCLSSRLVFSRKDVINGEFFVQVGISNCDGGVWWNRLKKRRSDRQTDRQRGLG